MKQFARKFLTCFFWVFHPEVKKCMRFVSLLALISSHCFIRSGMIIFHFYGGTTPLNDKLVLVNRSRGLIFEIATLLVKEIMLLETHEVLQQFNS